MSLDYRPPPTLARFMQDGTSLVRCAVGPVGSGKSMCSIVETLRRARQQDPHEGVRSSRFAVIRNTLPQLRQTVLNDIKEHLGPLVHYVVTDSTVQIRANQPDGTTLHSDWMLIPLDTKEDQKRLLSLQLTGAWINELREVPFDIVDPLIGRLGRYPSKLQGGACWHGLIADTNPWDVDSPYHEAFVLEPRKGWTLYHQPSGIGPDAENVENLPSGYYESLATGRNEDWSAVHVESQFGSSNAGQAVFRRSFHVPTHVRDELGQPSPHRPLIVGMDFGRTPSALIGQIDALGRLLVFEEVTTEDMGLYQMLEEHLMPRLRGEAYAGRKVFVIADPSGVEQSQLTNDSPFDALRATGFLAYPAPTNDVEPRLRAVERMLRTTILGEPGIQISRRGCPTLIMALGNKYRYKKKVNGQLEDRPEKLHPWSDVVDCLQYMALGASGNYAARAMRHGAPRPRREQASAAGWT